MVIVFTVRGDYFIIHHFILFLNKIDCYFPLIKKRNIPKK